MQKPCFVNKTWNWVWNCCYRPGRLAGREKDLHGVAWETFGLNQWKSFTWSASFCDYHFYLSFCFPRWCQWLVFVFWKSSNNSIRLQLDALQFRVINRQQLSYPLGSASVESTVLTEWPLQGLTRRDSKEIARRYGKLIERMYRPD